jgi:hypothetical protein
MYLAAHIPQKYTPRVRLRSSRGLGVWPFDTAWFQNIQGQLSARTYDPSVLWMPQQPTVIPTTTTAGGATASPPSSSNSLIVPGSSATDVLLNALTGKATTTQIQSNIDSCVASIQRMRQLAAANPGTVAAPPAGAEQQCATDQASFMANAVSPSNVLQNILPSPGMSTALWVLLGIGGVIGLVIWSRR